MYTVRNWICVGNYVVRTFDVIFKPNGTLKALSGISGGTSFLQINSRTDYIVSNACFSYVPSS